MGTYTRSQCVHTILAGLALAVCALVAFSARPVRAQLLAFPGADGAGALASGGRGGIVYHVTKLDTKFSDSGVGTLRYGLNDANFKDSGGNVIPRTIVFDVGGTIWLGRNPTDTEGWDTEDPMSIGSNVTLAGQTAPGGITIMGGGLKANGNNSIIRNVVIAPGYGTRSLNSTTGYADSYVFDGMNIHANNVIIDHVSTVFSTDEGISADEFANNVTVQYSDISQGQNYPQADAENPGTYTGHALGSLWQPGTNAKTSILHNLYAQQKGRLVRVGTETSKLTSGVGAINDIRNNVIYNWYDTAGTGASGQPSSNNFVGNFYLAGPGGDDNSGTTIISKAGGTSIFNGSSASVTGVYQSGNLKDTNKDGDANDGVTTTAADFTNSTLQANPYAVPVYGVTDSATAAYQNVLNYAGANWNNRNSIDARLVNEVRTGTGKITAFNDPTHGTDWNALLALRSVTNGGVGGTGAMIRSANFDSDGDGMPDAWEAAHGLNPNVADNNGDFDSDGYTNLEEYINELGEWPAPQPLVFNPAGGRFELSTSWNILWQPSRYDEAQINSGVCTITSVGQHANVVRLATSAGNVAEMDISGGWLKVESGVVIGNTPTSQGTLRLSGGELSTPLLTKGAAGQFFFTGGKLHADAVAFDLVNQGGVLAPGDTLGGFNASNVFVPGVHIGQTHVLGNLTLQSGSLEIELGSHTLSDSLTIDSLLTLGGTLDVELFNGFQPQVGDRWQIASAAGITGSFAAITTGFTLDQEGGNLFLVSQVPEPSSAILMLLGLLAVGSTAFRSTWTRKPIPVWASPSNFQKQANFKIRNDHAR
ncbi:MAG TPA: PEP-CTERM sorting domain-containing protein [Pirellulales bacterium]|jgi:hypothetical protein|nr:PEP-CTERM sorting domain-containing protein [Pirellulales bacterium]